MDESAILRIIDDEDEEKELAKWAGMSKDDVAMAPTTDSGLESLASEGLLFEILNKIVERFENRYEFLKIVRIFSRRDKTGYASARKNFGRKGGDNNNNIG
jgi:hypothetical protein